MNIWEEYYPTPPNLAAKVCRIGYKMTEGTHSPKVLDPSAGKGDILIKLKDVAQEFRRKPRFFAYEINPTLQGALAEHAIVLGSDWLEAKPRPMDLIIMNPPFSTWHDHVAKALDNIEMYGGGIAAILPATARQTTNHKGRELLNRLAKHDTTLWHKEGAAFMAAERRTMVEIEIMQVYVSPKEGSFFIPVDGPADPEENEEKIGGVIRTDELDRLIITYNFAQKKAREITSMNRYLNDVLKSQKLQTYSSKDTVELYEEFVSGIRSQIWAKILNTFNLQAISSRQVRADFENFIQLCGNIELTKDAVLATVTNLYDQKGAILEQCICEVHDWFRKYHQDNAEAWLAWKTNDAFKVKNRVILPHIGSHSWSGRLTIDYRNEQAVNDIDRAMCALTGERFDSITTIYQAVEARAKGQTILKSTFFEVKIFKKGTMHLKFISKDLNNQFNIAAARGKKWLPA